MAGWVIENIRTVTSAAVLLALLIWESFAPFFAYFTGKPGARVRHGVRNVGFGIFNGALTSLTFLGLWWWVARLTAEHQFGILHWLRLPGWIRVAVAFLLFDLWMYCWHRMNHVVPFLWRFHRVHHSDLKMDVTTANRFHVGEILFSGLLRLPVIALTGIQLGELALYELAMFTVVQLHHANVSLSAPLDRALRLFIVTPFMHKVHHSNWQPETDSNYSSLFSFWDRCFRSFRLRPDPRTLRLGLEELSGDEHQSLAGMLATPLRQIQRPDPASTGAAKDGKAG